MGATETAPNGDFTLVAEFADVSPLLVGNTVQVDGVTVGTVANMAVRNNKARVSLELEESALPVHRDAKATVRPVSLLGERYVDLDRGSPSAPVLWSGEMLSAQRTGQATDLDQVLNTIDDPTGQALAALVSMLGQGMQGNGAATDAAIRALPSSMRDVDSMARVLGDQNELLARLVDHVQPVAAALAADGGKSMDNLVGSANQLLGTTARNQDALDTSLAELPSTLRSARSTLSQLAGTVDATTPVLRGIRPTTDNLVAISQELRRFSESANPALATAQPVLRRGAELVDQARPVVDELQKASPHLRRAAAGLGPLATDLAGNIGNVLNFVKYWALATNGWDGLSHYFRGMVAISPDQITGLLPQGGATEKQTDTAGQSKRASPALPVLPGANGSGGLLDKPQDGAEPDGGVTGLNQKQESGVLDFLLGGQ